MLNKIVKKISYQAKSHFFKDVIQKEIQGFRKTKIICTIGPSVQSKQSMLKLLDAGMDVARFNLSHGNFQYHQNLFDNLKAALKQRPQKLCALLFDTKGPQIRTGKLKQKTVKLIKGNKITLTTDYNYVGDEQKVACSYKQLPQSVQVNNKILIADSSIVLQVVQIRNEEVDCLIMNDSVLGHCKNISLPNCVIKMDTITEKDVKDITQFGIKNCFNFYALSFARYASDIEYAKKLLQDTQLFEIIAKIEASQALENFHQIIRASQGIMIARGDLGMEIPIEKVTLAQKYMINNAIEYKRFSVTATQMLQSMCFKPNPTRAQISDITNAVHDGTDAVMLSGQTANGLFPQQSVKIMAQTCLQAQHIKEYQHDFVKRSKNVIYWSNADKHCSEIVQKSFEDKTDIIICHTQRGYLPQVLSRWRPRAHVIAVTPYRRVAQNLCIYNGILPIIHRNNILQRQQAQKIIIDLQKKLNLKHLKGIWAKSNQYFRL